MTAPPQAGAPPSWIAELSPRGKADVGAQIRIRFADDIVPVEALEAPDRQAALAKIEIAPPLPGHFVFVTPRMVSFSAEQPIPKASRIVVTLRAGLSDLKGHTLARDVAYAFRTEPVAIVLPSGTGSPAPQGPRPRVEVDSNVRLDPASLAAHASLVPAAGGVAIPLTIATDGAATPKPEATPETSTSFDDEPGGFYTLVPDRDVALNATYRLTIGAGVRPAIGNVATAETSTGTVRTYGPLTFSGLTLDTTDSSRPLVSGDPKLEFDNDLDAASAAASIALSPAAKPGYTLLSVRSSEVAINPAALEPHTSYTVTIAPGLKDAFGQQLAGAQTAHFSTEALAPDLWAPAGFSIFPATTNVALNVATANLPGNHYGARFVRIQPDRLIDRDVESDDDLAALLGDDGAWPSVAAPSARDVESTTQIPLAKTFGGTTGLLAYGVAADYGLPGATTTHAHIAGAVQVTNVGVFAQWFPTGGFVRAHHLADGSPIAGAAVDVYESKPAGAGSRLPCASGRTDATGTLDLGAARFARCLSVATADDQAPALLAIVRDGNDWSFVRTSPFGGGLGEAGYESWSAGVPHSRGSFISDRNLYQRGETAYFSAIGYYELAGNIVRGSSKTYAVTMKSPQGKVVALGRHALDDFGSFDVRTTLAADADLGDWTISATGDRGEAFQGTFTVAQFRPPNFKVAVAVDAKVAVPGESVTATTTSTYLFGAPVAGGREHVAVTRSRSTFLPKGYEQFAYGPSYEYPEEPPTLEGDVTQADLVAATDGTTSLAIPIASDLPYPADYRVDGETKDVSNLAVSDTQTFAALPSRNLIVLRGDELGDEQTPFPFDFAVVDPDGKAVEGRRVHFTLARRVYDRATQLVEGSETERPSVHYETVTEFDAGSAAAVQHLHVTPARAGEYRLRANFDGATGEATATDLDLYVAGADADWYRGDDKTLQVKLDRTTYKPGDTATALVASPYADAELMFAIVRNRAITRKIVRAEGATARISFVVTSDMVPNAMVEAVLVRRGPSLASGVPAALKDLSRVGFAPLKVALDAQYVTVTIAPASAATLPGATQSVRLHVADAGGAPVEAELTVAVANDAILQLSGYRFPDLVQQIYADLPVSTRYGDNRGDVKLASEHRSVEKGFGYGGGAMAGPAGTRVRTNFRPIAYFDGAVRTDASGDATVRFALPDDLTTWRVLAVALTRDARFGSGDATFVATKPLVTNAILPQFARPGDTLQGGVSVTDVTASAPGSDAGDVDVEGALDGALAFTDPAGRTASTKTHFEGRTAGYRFAMLVAAKDAAADRAIPDARVTFKTTLAGATDAFSVPLPIVSDDVLESVVDTGTTMGTISVPLTVDPALPNDLGGLHLTLASTLLGDTLAPLDAELRGDGDPFGFEAAARVAIAADRISLERRYGHTADVPDLLKVIACQRERLRALSKPDGSYAFYPNGPGDLFTSAFVAIQLAQAKKAGVDVSADLASVRRYLLAELADPAKHDQSCTSDRCLAEARLEALETLAPLGEVRSDHLSEIYDLRDRMSYYERVEMARHLIRLPAWHDRGMALRDTLLEQLYETGRRAGLVQASDFGESPVDGQSQLLGLMIESGTAGDRVDRAFSSLLGARGRDGTWGCGCADAEAMNAIELYAARDRVRPDFTGTATFGGEAFAQRFSGYAVTQATKDYPMASLPRGKTQIALARRGTGTLHYTVGFDYGVRGLAAGVYQGIRIDRIVRAAGATGEPIVSFGLAAPAATTTLDAGKVFDIEDRITTDHPLEGLVVRDALPAGLEAIDTRFQTNAAANFESVADWNIDYQTIERNRIVTLAQNLQPGIYAFHYLVRSVTPGVFAWPAARASLALAPDEFGRSAAGTLTVR